MTKTENATQWAINIANDNSHGYSQQTRWGPSYDCSSLVISAYEQAGVPVKSRGATYTGNMYDIFIACGFKDVTSSCNLSNGSGICRGDVLLNKACHAAMSIGDGKVVHARSSEGTCDTADNSGNEIRTQNYWNYPWDCILRFADSEAKSTTNTVVTTPTQTSVPTQTTSVSTGVKIQYMNVSLPLLTISLKDQVLQSVKSLQVLLNQKGNNLTVDGQFGPSTENAVKIFQAKNGLTADGECGANTWKKLIEN